MRTLLAACLTLLPATCLGAAPDDARLSKADRLAVQAAIVAGDDNRALKRLDAALPAGGWCPGEIDGPPEATIEQLHADLGVLARRTGRMDEAIGCLALSLIRRGARGQAAALFEAGLLVQVLDDAGRRALQQRLRQWREISGAACLSSDHGGPSLVDCALTRAARAGRGPADIARELVEHAAIFAPRPAYVRRLDRATAERSGALRPPFEPLTAAPHPSRERAIHALVRSMMPPERKPRPTVRETAKGPWRLLDVEVAGLREDQDPALDGDVYDLHQPRRALLLYTADGADAGVLAFDLGVLHDFRQPDDLTFERWDPIHGTVTLLRSRDTDDPSPLMLSEREVILCQTAGGQPPRCVGSVRRRYDYPAINVAITHNGVPSWGWSAGRLVARSKPGDYVHPQFAALEGKTLAEAIDLLPAVMRTLRADLGHPDQPPAQ